jgi:hypothetical protein
MGQFILTSRVQSVNTVSGNQATFMPHYTTVLFTVAHHGTVTLGKNSLPNQYKYIWKEVLVSLNWVPLFHLVSLLDIFSFIFIMECVNDSIVYVRP